MAAFGRPFAASLDKLRFSKVVFKYYYQEVTTKHWLKL